MAYPPHYLLAFGGTLGSPHTEIWSCGIRMVVTDGDHDSFNPEDWLPGTAVPALAAWFARTDTRVSIFSELAYAKCNEIAPSGRYANDDVTNEYLWPTPVPGGVASGNMMPFQCSLTVSWHTDAATRGPASRGRIYQPTPMVTMTTGSGLFDLGQAEDVASSAATLLNSLDDSIGFGGTIRPAIVSNIGAGSYNQIDAVSVDNRVDIIRRRGNALDPARIRVDVDY